MRLLEMKSPGEFSLIHVATHDTLPYAILSHTWADQEVTYQDLISGTGKSKSGYEKIKFCGEQAAKDGLRYFWVDTCCIDKSNSTELSKAINSMFRWYRNAKKCYVYLTDVSTPGDDVYVQANQSTWEVAFRSSRWFTRGWTLQELIAPADVEFFSQERKLLGDKRSLEKPIFEITQIPFQALRGDPFSDFSIAERKRWVAQRQTTEEEDLVYCLLGLCEVSMPPIYGEGKEAALKRLEMTVKGFSTNESEPKDLKDDTASFIVPFGRNLNFTGRGTQLTEVEAKLFTGGGVTKVAITGLGGIGKTQLLLELVYRIKDRYKDCLVIWIPATNTESLHQAYREVARQLKIPGSDEDKADVKKLVQDYLSKESAGRWLLVFDNADDVNMWITVSRSGSGRLIDCLPRSEQGCIVFTTRDRKTAVKLAHQNIVEVPEMGEDVAIQLLQKCLVDSDLVNNRPDTTALLKELTYLPLAIVQAAAYINENGIAFADYLSLLAEQEEDVIDLLSEEFEDDGRYDNIKNPVATTWLISPQGYFPVSSSGRKVSKKEIDAIGTLDAYSFIIKRAADQALDLHRLVHLATRNWLQQNGLITQWTERAIIRLEEVFPDDDHQNRTTWRKYLPHVCYALMSDEARKDGETRIALSRRYGACLFSDGRYNEATVPFVEVMERDKSVFGQEHPDTLTSMANLASTYRNQGRWKEAEDLEVQVMETSLRVLGQEHPSTLTSMANLAATFWNQGRWKEAEDLQVQVMETRKRVLGQEHPDTLTSMNNLALTWKGLGRDKEALKLMEECVLSLTRIIGTNHPNTLSSRAILLEWKIHEPEIDL
ncbi:kinesin light chain [Botrytis cinerea]